MATKNKLNSVFDHNSLYYILKETKLRSHNVIITQRGIDEGPPELCSYYDHNSEVLQSLGKILSNSALRRVSFYALDAGAVTRGILRETLSLNHGATVRAIRALQSYGILSPALPIHRSRGAKGGRRVIVYQTPEGTQDQIAAACELQRRLEYPKYRLALRYTQVLLEEYFEPKHHEEITYRDLLKELKTRRVPEAPDIAELMVPLLLERGVKVWR
jgi:DNA-binding MarR family transcriptional regulator